MTPARKTEWRWLALLAVALGLAQIDQPYPDLALLQHLPTLAFLLGSPWILQRWPLSNAALGCIVTFLLLHTLGGRYAYSYVPYDQWFAAVTGVELADVAGWNRNHYDRLVHFAFGLLAVLPVVEGVARRGIRLGLGFWIAMAFVMSASCLYEIFEWFLTVVMAGPSAEQYNGQQGDIWDAQKDMALATLGGLVTIVYLRWRETR